MSCKSQGAYSDFIAGYPDSVQVNVILEPATQYVWELTDGFGNVYTQVFTTDDDGAGIIDMAELPAGFTNPYQANLKIRVKENSHDCEYVPLKFIMAFDCISLAFKGGTIEKDWIGCEFDPPPDLPRLAAPTVTVVAGDGVLTVTVGTVAGATDQLIQISTTNFSTIADSETGDNDGNPVDIAATNGTTYRVRAKVSGSGYNDSFYTVATGSYTPSSGSTGPEDLIMGVSGEDLIMAVSGEDLVMA